MASEKLLTFRRMKATMVRARSLINSGQWENGKKHGEGIYTYANKDIYSGWWAFGNRQGKGTYIYASSGDKVVVTWLF